MIKRNRLRIAQVAPLYESVPPKLYGGTERVIHYLTEGLVAQGHRVTLFASGDSTTSADLVPLCPKALRLDSSCMDKLVHHVAMLDSVLSRSSQFDIIHFHIDYLHFPLSRHCHLPNVTTLHGRIDLPDLVPLYKRFHDMPLISISYAQRKPLADAHWVGNVYHGVQPLVGITRSGEGGYLAFLGRISPEKRPDRAIQIALATGMHLKIAAKIDAADRTYFETEIKPLLRHPNIEYIGEIGQQDKAEFLGAAYAYLFPIDWPEPFGLTMIEAMGCGTPTIAFSCGSVPEIMKDGVTGFVVHSMEEAIAAVRRIGTLDRRACQTVFRERFTSDRMVREYEAIYERLIRQRQRPSAASEGIPLPLPGAKYSNGEATTDQE